MQLFQVVYSEEEASSYIPPPFQSATAARTTASARGCSCTQAIQQSACVSIDRQAVCVHSASGTGVAVKIDLLASLCTKYTCTSTQHMFSTMALSRVRPHKRPRGVLGCYKVSGTAQRKHRSSVCNHPDALHHPIAQRHIAS